MKKLRKIELNTKNKCGLAQHIMPRNPIITARADYNAELLYSPLKIILINLILIQTTVHIRIRPSFQNHLRQCNIL